MTTGIALLLLAATLAMPAAADGINVPSADAVVMTGTAAPAAAKAALLASPAGKAAFAGGGVE